LEKFLNIDHNLWENSNLSPVFSGGYNARPEKSAIEILANYYKVSNAKLEEDFGIDFTQAISDSRENSSQN
jgi:hypothetical protein